MLNISLNRNNSDFNPSLLYFIIASKCLSSHLTFHQTWKLCSFIAQAVFLSRQLFSFWLTWVLPPYFESLDAQFLNIAKQIWMLYHKNSNLLNIIWETLTQQQYCDMQCIEQLAYPQVFWFLILLLLALQFW